MDILLFNTLGRKKEVFTPINPGKVGVYSCGPTVYRSVSIGNYRAYLFADLLRRMFELNGYEVRHVMNITDVGHLTDNGSDGEDKLEKEARAREMTAWDIAQMYTDEFLEGMSALNLLKPAIMPKATDHIKEQIAMIETLLEKGFAYQITDGLYFDTAKLPDYGILTGQKLEEKEEGARVEVNEEKRNPSDFALWKFSPEDEKRQMEWESPWGVGFPGWHIECSAMSETYLDSPFDIHTGGEDLAPVHHTNEMAQTEGARGNKLANYWMHNGFLTVDGGKMSKSLGNTYTIRDLIARGYDPIAFRYFTLGAHYKSPQNFTFEALDSAQNALKRLRATVREWNTPTEIDASLLEEFKTAVNNDLDTSAGLAVLWKLVDSELESGVKSATILAMDSVLGLHLELYVAKPLTVSSEIESLLREREAARAMGDFAKSDELRALIESKGFIVKDTKDGQKLVEG